jgi:uncharacterized protein (TIGR02301 family)
MTRIVASALATVLVLVLSGPAAAAETEPPPFEADLLRLSEILGALAYLDQLCGTPGAALWRGKMQALIEDQKMNPEDRRKYVDVYNRGHRTFSTVHRACTDQTRSVISRYLTEGSDIAGRLQQRFGRPSG